MTTDDKPTGYNGHDYFTIDDIAAMLPSPARLMPEVARAVVEGLLRPPRKGTGPSPSSKSRKSKS